MPAHTIIILDSNHDHTEILKGFVESEGFQSQLTDTIEDAYNRIKADDNGMVLLNYQVILESERSDVIDFFKKLVTTNRLILYNVPENADQRLAFYDLGAQRVFDTSFSLEEVFYSLKWLLRNMTEVETDQQLYSKGRLRDMSLVNLINSMGGENRTGVLKIVASNNSGKIYFQNGDIDDAQVGPHSGIKALIHLLYWQEGTFSFTPTLNEKARNNIDLSNVGVILLAEKYHKKFIEDMGQLGSLQAMLRIVNKGDVLVMFKELIPGFIEFLTSPRLLDDVLENPYYTKFETAENLVDLKNKGFLLLTEAQKAGIDFPIDSFHSIDTGFGEVVLNKEEIQRLKRNLKVQDDHLGKLLIIASKAAGKTEFIRQITKSTSVSRTEQNIDVAQVSFGSEFQLLLFGVLMDQKELETAEKLSAGLLGYIFMVDFMDKKQHEYQNYMINHLLSKQQVPHVIAVTNTSSKVDLKSMQEQFQSAIKANWIECSPSDIQSIREVLLAIKPIKKPRKKKKETKK